MSINCLDCLKLPSLLAAYASNNYTSYGAIASRRNDTASLLLRWIHRILWVVCALFTALPAFAQDFPAPKLTVYTEIRYPADFITDQAGASVARSYATDLVEAVLDESGFDYSIEVVPWARAMQAVSTESNVLAYSMAHSEERDTRFHWIGLIRPINISLYGLRARLHELPTTLAEARDYRIGNLRGDVVDIYLSGQGFPNLVYFRDFSRSISMLNRRRIDLIPFGEHGIGQFLQQNDIDPETLVPVIRIDDVSTTLNLVASLSTDNAIKDRLRAAYLRVVESGLYRQIMGFEWDSDADALAQ